MTHTNGWMSALSRVYKSPGAVYARLEDLRYPWLKTHRLVARRVLMHCLLGHLACRSTRLKAVMSIGLPARRLTRLKNGVVYWITGSPLDETQNDAVYWATGSPCDETSLAGSELPNPGRLISWRFQSKPLQAMPLEVRWQA